MYAPLTQFRYITPSLIFLSIVVNVVLMLEGGFSPVPLWVNWVMAGVLASSVWRIVAGFSLDGGANVKAFAITWPLLSLTMNFSYCYFAHTELLYRNILQLIAMLAMLTLILSLWQKRVSILKHLIIGLIIGVVSVVVPHTILWLLLLPIASYFMRSWSPRNILSAITGILLGIWIAYCIYFIGWGETAANQMIAQYASITRSEDFLQLFQGIGLWQYIFLGFMGVLLIGYSASAGVINTGSVRVGASVSLIIALGFALVVLFFLDLRHLPAYLDMFALFLGLQLTIHQANHHSSINEWWTVAIIVVVAVLCILPLFLT